MLSLLILPPLPRLTSSASSALRLRSTRPPRPPAPYFPRSYYLQKDPRSISQKKVFNLSVTNSKKIATFYERKDHASLINIPADIWSNFNAIHVSNLWSNLSKLPKGKVLGDVNLRCLLSRTSAFLADHTSAVEARQVATIFCSVAKIGIPKASVLETTLAQQVQGYGELVPTTGNSQEVANTAWALATRLRPGSLVGTLRPGSLVVGLGLLAFDEKYFNVKLLFEERSDVVILGVA